MSGCIGVPCMDTGRFTAFSDSLANLRKPEGTEVRFAVCNDRRRGRNELVRWMLKAGDEWMLFVDDDQVFAPDLLERLLSHNVDIVGALCLRKDEPYAPFCFSEILEDGRHVPIDLREQPTEGLIKVEAVGTGAMLIRRSIFERLPDPWFITAERSEDMIFCRTLRALDCPIFCDLGARLGHMTTAAIWPSSSEKGWAAGFVISGETTVLRPFTKSPEPIEV